MPPEEGIEKNIQRRISEDRDEIIEKSRNPRLHFFLQKLHLPGLEPGTFCV